MRSRAYGQNACSPPVGICTPPREEFVDYATRNSFVNKNKGRSVPARNQLQTVSKNTFIFVNTFKVEQYKKTLHCKKTFHVIKSFK